MIPLHWLFVYGTLLDYAVQDILFNRKVTVYSYTMEMVECCTGLDGFKYLATKYNSNVEGLILELTTEEVALVGEWLGSLYCKKCMYTIDLDRVLFYYTYEEIPDEKKRKYMTLQGNLNLMTETDVRQLASDFIKYRQVTEMIVQEGIE